MCPDEAAVEKGLQAEPDAGDPLPCYVFIQYSQFYYPCNSCHKESGLFPALCKFMLYRLCQPVPVLFPESGG